MRHTTRCAGPSATPQLIPISTAAATERAVWARNLVYFSPYSLYFYLIISDRLFHENIDVEQVHFFAISLLFYFKIWEVSRLKLTRIFLAHFVQVLLAYVDLKTAHTVFKSFDFCACGGLRLFTPHCSTLRSIVTAILTVWSLCACLSDKSNPAKRLNRSWCRQWWALVN